MTENRKRLAVSLVGAQRCAAVSIAGQQRHVSIALAKGGAVNNEHAKTADRLTDARRLALTGEAVGEGYFDGSADVDIYVSVTAMTNSELEVLLNG